MKLVFSLLLCFMIGTAVEGADILKLVKVLDANDTALFKSIVVSAEDANAMREDNNKTVLMYASWIGNIDAVKYLVCKKAEVNAQDIGGATALHLSIWQGHDAISLYLLRHGASANAMTKEGMTPLDIAMLRNNQVIMEEINTMTPKLKPLL